MRLKPAVSITSPTIGGVLIGSPDPERLRRWYAEVLATEPDSDGVLHVGAFPVIIGPRLDVAPRNPEPHRLVLNVQVDDIAAYEATLVRMGAVWARELETTPWGRIATVVDPDGNYLQLIENDGRRSSS